MGGLSAYSPCQEAKGLVRTSVLGWLEMQPVPQSGGFRGFPGLEGDIPASRRGGLATKVFPDPASSQRNRGTDHHGVGGLCLSVSTSYPGLFSMLVR